MHAVSIPYRHGANEDVEAKHEEGKRVSIPYRHGANITGQPAVRSEPIVKFQFLIGTARTRVGK